MKSHKKIGGRKLKKKVAAYLRVEHFEDGLCKICRLPPRQVVNPLFSFLCSIDERIKWRAVTAMGQVVSNLAGSDLESARVVMRRFLWQLNDESGGIGWGCPESMAEAMSRNGKMADEFHRLLISYIQPEGNYLEHPVLQRGVLWGVGRLANCRPQHASHATAHLLSYMHMPDPILRGLAAWASGPIAGKDTILLLEKLLQDQGRLTVYRDAQIKPYTVGQLAREALGMVEQRIKYSGVMDR